LKLEEKLGIKKELLIQIQSIFSKFKCVETAVIFGSRARGDYKYNSDIDIAVSGSNMTFRDFNLICDELNGLNTAFTFDLLERLAFRHGFITDGDDWITMMLDRNRTSYVYDEKLALEIFNNIKTRHIKLLNMLVEKFETILS
jgi:predicted nucleotidyltransferase